MSDPSEYQPPAERHTSPPQWAAWGLLAAWLMFQLWAGARRGPT